MNNRDTKHSVDFDAVHELVKEQDAYLRDSFEGDPDVTIPGERSKNLHVLAAAQGISNAIRDAVVWLGNQNLDPDVFEDQVKHVFGGDSMIAAAIRDNPKENFLHCMNVIQVLTMMAQSRMGLDASRMMMYPNGEDIDTKSVRIALATTLTNHHDKYDFNHRIVLRNILESYIDDPEPRYENFDEALAYVHTVVRKDPNTH